MIVNFAVVRTLVADDVSAELLAEAATRASADDVEFAGEIIDLELARAEDRLISIDARLDELAEYRQ